MDVHFNDNSSLEDLTFGLSFASMPVVPKGPVLPRALLLCVGVPLIIITILGNLLVLIAWAGYPRLRTPSTAYLASLALVDLLIGCISMTLGVAYNFHGKWTLGVSACQFWLISNYSCVFISSSHLVLVAVDRHRIVFEGVAYIHNRRMSTVFQSVLAAWVVGLWIASPIGIDWNRVSVDPDMKKLKCIVKHIPVATVLWMSIGILFPAILLVWLYARIYFELRRKWRERNVTRVTVIELSSTLSLDSPLGDSEKKGFTKLSKQRRAAVTLGILIGLFIFCWTPYLVLVLCVIFGVDVLSILIVLCAFLGWTNSAINPIVYAVRNEKFREAFKTILIGICRLRRRVT